MNKQQLQQEIAELQKQLEEKQKALSAMPDKWSPKAGDWFVNVDSTISNTSSMDSFREFGVEYATREQAEKAAKAMRAHNRLLAYVAEFAPDYEPDWSKGVAKYYVYFDFTRTQLQFRVHSDAYSKRLGLVYMPEHIAVELARKLNSGEVEL